MGVRQYFSSAAISLRIGPCALQYFCWALRAALCPGRLRDAAAKGGALIHLLIVRSKAAQLKLNQRFGRASARLANCCFNGGSD